MQNVVWLVEVKWKADAEGEWTVWKVFLTRQAAMDAIDADKVKNLLQYRISEWDVQ